MIGDLVIGIAATAAGIGGLAAVGLIAPHLPEWLEWRRELAAMSETALHAELTKCAGAAMVCARYGDRKGMRHAYRAMRPVLRMLARKGRAE